MTRFLPLRRRRPGYVFLVSVLVIGVIAVEVALSLVLLGIAAEQSGLAIVQSGQALEFAHTCVERTLRELRADVMYDGGTVASFDSGTCSVRHLGGSGNADRAICAEGRSGKSVRRIEVSVRQVYPRVEIVSWKEVSSFSLCP